MKAARRVRLTLILGGVGLLGMALTLLLWANQNQINLFFSPSDFAAGEVPAEQTIRAGGLVVAGSVQRDPDSLEVRFEITDNAESIPVRFNGILPDLFREGQGIVATGRLGLDGRFVADEVLAKHDETYMPPEVARALEQAKENGTIPYD